MPGFLAIRCQNAKCNHLMCGPEVSRIVAHDFEKAPFVELCNCGLCCTNWMVTIPGLNDLPSFREMEKKERVNLVLPEDFFGLWTVERRQLEVAS